MAHSRQSQNIGRHPLPADALYLRPLLSDPHEQETGFNLAGGWRRFSRCSVIVRGAPRRTVSAEEARQLAPDVFARLVEPRPELAGLSPERPRIMGIVNVTPDSFSDGGRYLAAADAVAHGRALAEAGADLLDIGGESTRPGATAVAAVEEVSRVEPVVAGLRGLGLPLSVDTRSADVLRAAVGAGAAILNDVSGLRHDPDMAPSAAALGIPVVIMHSRGTPADMNRLTDYGDVLLDVYDELAAAIAAAEAAGIDRNRIVVDPGIGFAKTAAQSAALLRDLALFHGLGCPLLVGVSRKSFIARLAGDSPADRRLAGSLAAALWAVDQGAQVLRVHDVAETAQALAVWRAVAGGGISD